jgi:hypothetical protein
MFTPSHALCSICTYAVVIESNSVGSGVRIQRRALKPWEIPYPNTGRMSLCDGASLSDQIWSFMKHACEKFLFLQSPFHLGENEDLVQASWEDFYS